MSFFVLTQKCHRHCLHFWHQSALLGENPADLQRLCLSLGFPHDQGDEIVI
jgi:hypothetical protein